MDDIVEAIATNNSGISHLMSKNYGEAMMSFLHSVKKTKDLVSRLRTYEAQEGVLHDRVGKSELIMDLVDLGTAEWGAAERFAEEDHISLVCRNAIIIRQSAPQRAIVEDLTAITVSAVYNLAMTYLLLGIDHRCTSHLETADHYYEFVLSWQKEDSGPGLVMSALNNMATIHRILNNENKVTRTLQQLFCTIVTQHHVDPKDAKRNQRRMMQYLSNLTSLFLNPPVNHR